MFQMFQLFFLFCLFLCPLYGQSEPLEVHVATEMAQIPLYLGQIPGEGGEPLQQVLLFDLSHNGKTQIITPTAQHLQWEAEEHAQGSIFAERWRAAHAHYVCKFEREAQTLTCRLYTTAPATVKVFPCITLTGSLSKDRGEIHRLADQITYHTTKQWGIASTKILYTVKIPNPQADPKLPFIAEVWESDWDGENARQVTHDHALNVTPIYLPPKPGYTPGNFLYVSYRSSQPKIYLGALKNGASERLCSVRGHQLMPAVSLQRDQLAFICDIGGNPDLFLQTLDENLQERGKPRQLFASVRGTQGSPTFSPDGKRIAFVSNKDGSPRIYMLSIPPEGTPLKEMTPLLISKTNRENTSPVWSPDGKKIAYSAMTKGVRQIWLYHLDSQTEEQITSSPGQKDNPSWAPNSAHLVYNSEDTSNNTGELYLVQIEQKQPFRISKGTGQKRFPAWAPRSMK